MDGEAGAVPVLNRQMKRKTMELGFALSVNLTAIFLAKTLDNSSHLFHEYRGNGGKS
jgi:hypothetical protein